MYNTELIKRIEKLEKQVELLQAEITAIKNIEASEKAREQIDKMERANKLVSLMENLSGEEMPDAQKYDDLEALRNISKQSEAEIQASMNTIEEFIGSSADKSDFEWQPYQDGVEITRYVGFNKETVIVPEMIHNLPVRKIGKEVFLNCEEMHHIILPETITEFGESVFKGSGLEEITLPSKIRKIPRDAFAVSNLVTVKCPENLEEIDENAFWLCRKLKTINLPNKLKKLGKECFYDTNISSIIMPSNGINIDKKIFSKYEDHNTNIAFCGMNDTFFDGITDGSFPKISKQYVFYCLPGSSAQQYARKNNIPVKHLSEFQKDI